MSFGIFIHVLRIACNVNYMHEKHEEKEADG